MDETQTPASGDVSRNVILVLVILTLLISILGTWTVLSQIGAGHLPSSSQPAAPGSGEVSFTLQAPPGPSIDAATGHVAFVVQ